VSVRALVSVAFGYRPTAPSRTVSDVAPDGLSKVTVASRRFAETRSPLDLSARDEIIRAAVVEGHPIDAIAEAAEVRQEEIVRVATSR
jgi:hypothetical protein